MPKRALIIVDAQNDFMPGGTLAVPRADEIIPYINRMMQLPFDLIVATQDFHPPGHCSFASTWGKRPGDHIKVKGVDQILWPDHCVQGSLGVEFAPDLDVSHFHRIVHKGVDPEIDSYSTFFDNLHMRTTGLEDWLRLHEIEELYFAGLATDYCVLYSLRDAAALKFSSWVVTDACKGINLNEGDVARALSEVKKLGAHLISTEEVENLFSMRLETT